MPPSIRTLILCLITLCSFVEPNELDGASPNTAYLYGNTEESKQCRSSIFGYLFLNDAFYHRFTENVVSHCVFFTMLSEFSSTSPFNDENDTAEAARQFVDKSKIDRPAREKLLSMKLDWNSISNVSRSGMQYLLVAKKWNEKGVKAGKKMSSFFSLIGRRNDVKLDTINYLEYRIFGEDALITPKSLTDLTYRDMVNWVAHYFECFSEKREDRKDIREACSLAFSMLTKFVKKQIETVNKGRWNSNEPQPPIVTDFSWKTISNTFLQKWNRLPTAYQNGITFGSSVILRGVVIYFGVPWLLSAKRSNGNSTNALDSLNPKNDSLPMNEPPKTPFPDLFIIFAIIGLLVLVAIIICFYNCYSKAESNFSTEKSKTCKIKSKKSKLSKKSKKSVKKGGSKSGKGSKVKATNPSLGDDQIKTRKSSGIEKNQSKKQVVKSKSIKRELKPQAVVRPLPSSSSFATSSVTRAHSSKRHLPKTSSSVAHSTIPKSTFEKPNHAPGVASSLPTLVKPTSNALVKPSSTVSSQNQNRTSTAQSSVVVHSSSTPTSLSKMFSVQRHPTILKQAKNSAVSHIKTSSDASIPFKTARSHHSV